jgi:hypothetical protein
MTRNFALISKNTFHYSPHPLNLHLKEKKTLIGRMSDPDKDVKARGQHVNTRQKVTTVKPIKWHHFPEGNIKRVKVNLRQQHRRPSVDRVPWLHRMQLARMTPVAAEIAARGGSGDRGYRMLRTVRMRDSWQYTDSLENLDRCFLREVTGFQECISLSNWNPSSVESIEEYSFIRCTSLRVVIVVVIVIVIVHVRCRMRENQGFRAIWPFIIYEADDVKANRSLFHLVVGGRWISRIAVILSSTVWKREKIENWKLKIENWKLKNVQMCKCANMQNV